MYMGFLLLPGFLVCTVCVLVILLGIYIKGGRSHEGMVLSSDLSLWSLMLMRVKHIVVKCARRVFANVCIALLCILL